jgi:hypothetical protein
MRARRRGGGGSVDDRKPVSGQHWVLQELEAAGQQARRRGQLGGKSERGEGVPKRRDDGGDQGAAGAIPGTKRREGTFPDGRG